MEFQPLEHPGALHSSQNTRNSHLGLIRKGTAAPAVPFSFMRWLNSGRPVLSGLFYQVTTMPRKWEVS